jgi:hypothetical protein
MKGKHHAIKSVNRQPTSAPSPARCPPHPGASGRAALAERLGSGSGRPRGHDGREARPGRGRDGSPAGVRAGGERANHRAQFRRGLFIPARNGGLDRGVAQRAPAAQRDDLYYVAATDYYEGFLYWSSLGRWRPCTEGWVRVPAGYQNPQYPPVLCSDITPGTPMAVASASGNHWHVIVED